MKAIGIVRNVDELGRIVLPVELRRTLGVDIKDSFEIFTGDNSIILRKYDSSCVFCSEASNTIYYKGKLICEKCIKEIKDSNK